MSFIGGRLAPGFTIVELLIVIVVIAILATVSIVAYNGIQDRAYLTKASSAVDTYEKLLQMYYTDQGKYPVGGSATGYYACMGSIDNYPASGEFAIGQCDSYPGYATYVNAPLNQALGKYADGMPDGSLPSQAWCSSGCGSLRGVECYSLGGQNADLYYIVNGNQQCPRGTADHTVHGGAATACDLILTSGGE